MEVYNMPFKTDKDTYKVLNHGDIWVNNIMFKCTADGKPVDLQFVSVNFFTCK